MQAKEFQKDAIESVDRYLEVLREEAAKWIKTKDLAAANPDLGLQAADYSEATWKRLREEGVIKGSRAFSARRSGTGEPVPNFTLKVPTGGGKTYLGVRAVERILDRYMDANEEKLVLWIVPSEAIYSQTKAALNNRDGSLRSLLDVASGNRVQVLEKDSALHRADLRANLTILLLMLPSANRQDAVNKLKMFQDRGNINGFLPADDDRLAHEALKKAIPNLDTVDIASQLMDDGYDAVQVGLVRSSLGNALRLVRPVIVLDEGHKGFSPLAHKTLYGFNPRIVVELTATPKDMAKPDKDGERRTANILVEVSGTQLSDEEMIKQPLVGKVSADYDPYAALAEAWQKTEELQAEADAYHTNGGDYIRPILLVQVERVGAEHIEGDAVHSEHVKQWFLARGVLAEAIKIKTSEQNDLAEFPPGDLMKPSNPTRIIITKAALQEGWDCPFAYVLCALAANRSTAAMTQLIGRILRQPFVKRTGVQALDQCYVFTNRVETKLVTDAVQKGLEQAGMGDLVAHFSESKSQTMEVLRRERREKFAGRDYYLPEVMVSDDGVKLRKIDWEADVLGRIDWAELKVVLKPGEITPASAEKAGVTFTKSVQDMPWDRVEVVEAGKIARELDLEFAIRNLIDEIPNAWIAYRVLDDYLAFLRADGWTEEELGAQQTYVLTTLTGRVRKAIDDEARKVFEAGLASNRIIFRLSPLGGTNATKANGWRVPPHETISISPGSRRLRNSQDKDLERSLFVDLFEKEFNGLEQPVAVFLDEHEAVNWWYRNAVRGNAYGLQGWRRKRIYPDFIVSKESMDGRDEWLIIETKGDQLAGNLDTQYKADLLETLTETGVRQVGEKIGQLALFEGKATYEFAVVPEGSWKEDISKRLKKS